MEVCCLSRAPQRCCLARAIGLSVNSCCCCLAPVVAPVAAPVVNPVAASVATPVAVPVAVLVATLVAAPIAALVAALVAAHFAAAHVAAHFAAAAFVAAQGNVVVGRRSHGRWRRLISDGLLACSLTPLEVVDVVHVGELLSVDAAAAVLVKGTKDGALLLWRFFHAELLESLENLCHREGAVVVMVHVVEHRLHRIRLLAAVGRRLFNGGHFCLLNVLHFLLLYDLNGGRRRGDGRLIRV